MIEIRWHNRNNEDDESIMAPLKDNPENARFVGNLVYHLLGHAGTSRTATDINIKVKDEEER